MALLPIANIDVDLTTVSTDYPVLKAGTYPFKITEAKVDSSKNGQSQLLIIVSETLMPGEDVNGSVVPIGHKITNRITLTPSEKVTTDMIARNIASLQDAVFGFRIPLSQFDTDTLLEQTFTATVKIAPATNEYPASNNIGRYIKKEVTTA